MPLPEVANLEPKYYGIKPEDLTDEVWADIQSIFFKVAYGDDYDDERIARRISGNTASNVLTQTEHSNFAGFRYGSRFSQHTKLGVWNPLTGALRFDLVINSENPDHEDPSTESGKEAEEMKELFQARAENYLRQHGIGMSMQPPYS